MTIEFDAALKGNRSLYFAYGSNMNKEHMLERCPNAIPIRPLELPDWELCFRFVADIQPNEGESVYGALWSITPECIKTLDTYEGFKESGKGLYKKLELKVPKCRGYSMMVYWMDSELLYPPEETYLESIAQGYMDFGYNPTTVLSIAEASRDQISSYIPNIPFDIDYHDYEEQKDYESWWKDQNNVVQLKNCIT